MFTPRAYARGSVGIFIVRVWLPDRPGALGAVASRIGAVRGDVVGIDILERGAGRAIDELVVQLPDESVVALLVAEISEVDGVDVEDVRPAGGLPDARLDALDTAAVLVGAATVEDLLRELVARAHHVFQAEWGAAFDLGGRELLAGEGSPPDPGWLAAFVAGTRSSDALADGTGGPDDAAWAVLEGTGMAVVLGRKGRPFRARERHELAALARIAGLRAAELAPAAVRGA